MRRSISPPVKQAALSSVSSIVADHRELEPAGPFGTAVLGPTVASDFVEPYERVGEALVEHGHRAAGLDDEHDDEARSRRRTAARRCGRRA